MLSWAWLLAPYFCKQYFISGLTSSSWIRAITLELVILCLDFFPLSCANSSPSIAEKFYWALLLKRLLNPLSQYVPTLVHLIINTILPGSPGESLKGGTFPGAYILTMIVLRRKGTRCRERHAWFSWHISEESQRRRSAGLLGKSLEFTI